MYNFSITLCSYIIGITHLQIIIHYQPSSNMHIAVAKLANVQM